MSRPLSSVLARSLCPGCGQRLGPRRARLAIDTPVQVPRHQIATRWASTTSTNTWPPSSSPDQNSSLQLVTRRTIQLQGPDATEFLHNLIPAPVLPLEEQPRWIATAFLNAKGRIIHDIMLRKPSKADADVWHLDVEANSAPAVLAHLKKHKLRSKVKIEQLDNHNVPWYAWPSATSNLSDHDRDPRPGMGNRGPIVASDSNTLGWEDYMIHRMLNGHAEGPLEIASGSALPQESNLDFYGGIDFHKGCYLGQELTIRTHHTGVVRKRILPVQIYSDEAPIPKDQELPMYDPSVRLPQPSHDANISKIGARGRSARSTGKWLRGYGNIGLALCRLETMTDLSLTAEGSQYDHDHDEFQVTWETANSETSTEAGTTINSVKVRAFVPPWLRAAINESIKARTERGAKNRSKENEDDEDLTD